MCWMLIASIWQAPSVFSCTAGMPSAAIFSASICPVMSPSMTPMANSWRSRSISAVSRVVLPAPGLPMMLTRQTFVLPQRLAHLGADVVVPCHDLVQDFDLHLHIHLDTVYIKFPARKPVQIHAAARRAGDVPPVDLARCAAGAALHPQRHRPRPRSSPPRQPCPWPARPGTSARTRAPRRKTHRS